MANLKPILQLLGKGISKTIQKTNGAKILGSLSKSEANIAKKLLKLENLSKDLSKMKIGDLDLTTKSGRKLANQIRAAKLARSNASKAELEWMQKNADKATLLKSGAREFSSDEAKAALNKIRLESLKSAKGLIPKNKLAKALKIAGITGGSALGVAGLLGAFAAKRGTGWTNTVLDLVGNNTRRKDGTPLFTVNRDFDDLSSNAQAFLQDAIDKKEVPGKWSTPEEREAYFKEHPNDTIRTGWRGRLTPELRKQGVSESDYKKYYGVDYGGLSDMPGATGFGINRVPADTTQHGIKRILNTKSLKPEEAGMYEIQQTLGSFPLAYTKDGVLTDGETWDYKEADRTAPYQRSILRNIRIFAGRNGTNEADNVQPIVTSNMKIPYKKQDKK